MKTTCFFSCTPNNSKKFCNFYNKVQQGLSELCHSSYSSNQNSSLNNDSRKIRKDDLIKQQENQLFNIQQQRIRDFFENNQNNNIEEQSIKIIKQFMLDLQNFSNEYINQNSDFSKRTFKAIELFLQIYHNQIDKEKDQEEIFLQFKLNDKKSNQNIDEVQIQKQNEQEIDQEGDCEKLPTKNAKHQNKPLETQSYEHSMPQNTDSQVNNQSFKTEQKTDLKVETPPPCFQDLILNLKLLSQSNQALAAFYRSNQIYKIKIETKKHELNNKLKENLEKKFTVQLEKMENEFNKLDLFKIEITDSQSAIEPNETLFRIKKFYDVVSILNDASCQNNSNEEKLKNEQGEEQLVLMTLKKKLNKTFEKQLSAPYQSLNDDKVRECLAFNLIRVQSIVPEPDLVKFCQTIIQDLWGKEKDNSSVKILLRNKEMINLQKQMFNSDLRSFSDKLKQGFKTKFDNLQEQEQKFTQAADADEKDKLKKLLQIQYDEFDQYIEGISEMGSKLDLSLLFLKEIRLKLTQISTKLEDISTTVTSVEQEIKNFTGGSYQVKLSIRKKTVIKQMQEYELRNVYIPLRTQEWNALTGSRISGKQNMETYLISDSPNDQEAEVNEFLYADEDLNKDVLLIRGNAGSGKTRAALKIEEFLWKQYIHPNKSTDIFIPIYIQLPTIREPRYNLLQQALEADLYQFSRAQYNLFMKDFQKNQFKLVLILDGYDEMKNDILQVNLYQTNGFIIQEAQRISDNCSKKQLKLIITTRNEILSNKNYPIWFCGQNVQTLKEVEILSFDSKQNEKYIKEFSQINLKRCFLSIYDFFPQNENFLQVWDEIQNLLKQNKNESNSDCLLSNEQIKKIMESIQNKPPFCLATQQQINLLFDELTLLWSVEKYLKIINNTNIQQLLTTPFILDIVIQVLPNMISKFSSPEMIKLDFEKHFIDTKKYYKKKQNLIRSFRQGKNLKEDNNDNLTAEQVLKNFENLEKINFFNLFSVDTNFTVSEQGMVTAQDQESMKIILNSQTAQVNQTQAENSNRAKQEKQDDTKEIQKQKPIEQIKEVNLGNDAYSILMTLKKQKITTYDFYDQFIEFYHQKQIIKQKQIGFKCNYEALLKDLQYFSEGLAKDLARCQLTQINYKIKGKLQLQNDPNKEITTWEDYYFNDFEGDGEYKKVIRSCMLINQKGNTFTFTHKSVQEFFVAKYFIELFENLPIIGNFEQFSVKLQENILLPQNKQQENFKDYLRENFNDIWFKFIIPLRDEHFNCPEFNLSSEHFHGSLRLMKSKLRNIYNIKDKLLQFVNLSKNQQSFIKAASNGLFLLSYIQEYLGKADLSNISIENTKLNGATFFQSNLEGSKFNNVDLNQCNFNCANLKSVQWENIPLSNQQNLDGHRSKINDIKIFQNNYAASCSDDALILIWDLKTFQQIAKFSYHIKKVYQLEVFENDQKLASVGEDKYFMIYELKVDGFKRIQSMYYSSPLYSVIWIQNLNLFLIGAKNNMIQISYEEQILKLESEYPEDTKVKAQALSPDQSLLAIGSINDIHIFELQNTHQIEKNDLKHHKDVIISLKFFPNNINLVSGSADKTLLIWDLIKGEQCQIISGNYSSISSISILGKDPLQPQLLAFVDGKDIQILDIKAGKIINSISHNQTVITTAILTKNENDENYVLFGCDNFEIRYRSIESIDLLKNEDAHLSEVTTLSMSPDGLTFASGGKDKAIKIWDMATGKLIQELHHPSSSSLCQVKFSNLGKYLASISEDGIVLLWDANLYSLIKHIELGEETGERLLKDNIEDKKLKKRAFVAMKELKNIQDKDKLEEQQQPSIITALISLDGSQYYSFAFANSNGLIQGIKNNKAEEIYKYSQITSLDYSKKSEEEVIAIGCQDGEIIIFSLTTKSVQKTINIKFPVQIIRLFQKQNQLLSGHAEGLVLRLSYDYEYEHKQHLQRWDLCEDDISTINLIEEDQTAFVGSSNSLIYLINFSDNDFQVFNEEINYQVLAISGNGSYLAIAKDSDIFFWNSKNQKFQKYDKSHDEAITILCFSDNEQILASGANDDLIHLWEIENDGIKCKFGTFYSHCAAIVTLFFFKSKKFDQQILVSISLDQAIAVWDIKQQEQILRLKTPTKIFQLCKFNKSNIIAIGFESDSNTSIQIVKFEKEKQQFNELITLQIKINSISVSNNDEILAVAAINKKVFFFKLDKNQKMIEQTQQTVKFEVLTIQFSFLKDEIVYLQNQDSLVVSNLNNCILKKEEIVNEFSLSLISFSTNGKFIAYSKKSSLGIIKLNENNKKEYLLKCEENSVTAFAISLNRQYFAVGKINGLITIWNLQNETYYHLEHHHKKGINFLKFINQDELFSAGGDSEITIFNIKTKTKQSRYINTKIQFISLHENQTLFVGTNLESSQNESNEFLFLEFSDLDDILAFRKKSGKLQFFNLKTLEFKEIHSDKYATAIAFQKKDSQPIKNFAYGNNSGQVVVVGQNQMTFCHHKDYITSLKFYQENQILSGSNDKIVCVSKFQNKNWEMIHQFKDFSKPIFNIYCQPTHNLFAVCDKSKKMFLYYLRFNENQKGNEQEIESHIFEGHQSEITSVIISPCGNYIVSASNDSCIKMWRSATNNQIYSNKLLEFKDNLICYKSIGIDFPFEAKRVQKEKSIIKSQKNEDLTSKFN